MPSPLHPMLYVSAVFPPHKLAQLAGAKATYRGAEFPVRRLAIDTEDAVREEQLKTALANIAELLRGGYEFVADVFIRVRNYSVLQWLLEQPNLHRFRGIVVPKANPATFAQFAIPAVDAGWRVLPILEARGVNRASFREALLDAFAPYRNMIDCVRMGVNDLMGQRCTRRDLSGAMTVHDQLGLIGAIVDEFAPEGYLVTGGVFEGIGPCHDGLFEREVLRDIAMGLFGKTVIHPPHLGMLEALYGVTRDQLESALGILEAGAPAVSRVNGRMDEPATHAGWAARVIERHEAFGLVEPAAQSATV